MELCFDRRVELLHFHMDDPRRVNSAFWRTCSFLLGSVLTSVFRDPDCATLHSFPAPNGRESSMGGSGWFASRFY